MSDSIHSARGDAPGSALDACSVSPSQPSFAAAHSRVGPDSRAVVAVTMAGIAAFLNLYATQPILPLLEQLFSATKANVGRTVSAGTLGVALSAPFCGALAARLGRRSVIVVSTFLMILPTFLAGCAGTLGHLVFWRFLQGLVMPGIFAIAVAYIGEEWPRHRVPMVTSIYVSGTVFGGFIGRMITGVLSTHALIPGLSPSWRDGFYAIAALDLVCALFLWRWLPADSPIPTDAPRQVGMRQHLHNPQLVATFVVGFNVLFSLVGTFSYITFYLAAAPFNLTAAQLSLLFLVYLVGLVVTPLGGMLISRVGSRAAVLAAVLCCIAGILVTLIHSLPLIMLGLVLSSSGVFICQSASTSYIQREAPPGGRSTASGLYVMAYYIGGSVAGILPGLLWRFDGWSACVGLIVLVQLATFVIVASIWKGRDVGPRDRRGTLPASAHA